LFYLKELCREMFQVLLTRVPDAAMHKVVERVVWPDENSGAADVIVISMNRSDYAYAEIPKVCDFFFWCRETIGSELIHFNTNDDGQLPAQDDVACLTR